jgi:energy-coupling factor transport system permease protein
MLLGVMVWFFFYTEIMTSDKFIYLFGKIIPSMSLVISMTLRFVPRFITQFKQVINAQKCMGNSITEGSIIKRGKNLLKIFSAMISWALENAIDTADSMKARGYGLPGRTAFSIYTMSKRDKATFSFIFIIGIYILVGGFLGIMEFKFFPYIKGAEINSFSISMYFAYLLLMIAPVISEVWEVRRWNALRSKI